MGNKKHVQAEWDSFSREMPADAPLVQLRVMRLAFFAGAGRMMKRVSAFAAGSDDEEFLEFVKECGHEFIEFIAEPEPRSLAH